MKTLLKQTLLPLILLLTAPVLNNSAAPQLEFLPTDYSNQLDFAVIDQFRATLDEPWVNETFKARRIDQSLSSTPDMITIQSALNWYNAKDQLIFLSSGYIYLADVPERYQAHTRGNSLLWVEPISGVVVRCEEHGTSYFARPATAANLGSFHL